MDLALAQPSGIFIIDKPGEMSSARLVASVKRILGVRKAGHTGTLDPFATGVMICCVNRATKLARFFLGSSKSYDATLTLGVENRYPGRHRQYNCNLWRNHFFQGSDFEGVESFFGGD